MLDGRVKTLHPIVHAGILARRESVEHMNELTENGVSTLDLIAVNLYPFAETVSSDPSRAELIENIDIGGVALISAAAKNHARQPKWAYSQSPVRTWETTRIGRARSLTGRTSHRESTAERQAKFPTGSQALAP